MKSKKFFAVILLCLICIVLFCACNKTGQYLIFGTFVDIELSGNGASSKLSEIEKRFVEIENLMSATKSGSDIYKINNAKMGEAVKVDKETMEVLKSAKVVYEISDGAFDPTVYPLSRLWKFSADAYVGVPTSIPSNEEVTSLLSLVGMDKLLLDEENLTVVKTMDGVQIDLGGLAKGYAAGVGLSMINGQKGIINVGGNIVAVGKDVTVGIQNPRGDGYVGKFTLSSGMSVSTSGDYERRYTFEGVDYHHIISPFTGYPSGIKDSADLISVTVISDSYTLCDAVTTAVMVLGKEKGAKLIESLNMKGVLIDSDLNITVIGNLDFTKTN
ncbi:MAG: FAD:protein FMN transferase [Christensenellales bacterium]